MSATDRHPAEDRLAGGHHVLVGVATALASVALVVVPVVLAWLVDARSTGSLGSAAATGSSLWFLLQGARLSGPSGVLGVTPLGLLALPVLVAAWGLRATLRECPPGPMWRGVLAVPVLRGVGLWWAGYVGALVPVALLASTAGLSPVWWTAWGAFLGLPAAVALTVLVRHRDGTILDLDPWLDRVPDVLRRSVRPGLEGAAALLGLGALLVVGLVAVHLTRVEHVHGALDAGFLGGLLLVVAELGSLPNLSLWGVSFLAGPGFQVVEGARTTWSGSRAGLLPMVPVLGALPAPGSFPAATALVVLLPLVVGSWVASRALAGLARLARARTKALVVLGSVTVTAVLLGLADVVGGGALGTARLADVGAPAGLMTVVLLGELVVGAVPVLAWDLWRRRR